MISYHIYNNSPSKITLHLGFLGYCETNATISLTNEIAYRVKNVLQLLDINQSTILEKELSINNILSNEIEIQTVLQNHPILNQHFNYQNTRKNNKIS